MELPTLHSFQKKYPLLTRVCVFIMIIAIPVVLLRITGNILSQFATVYSSTPNTGTFATNGSISSMLPDTSGGLYIGGTFSFLGTYTGRGLPILTSAGSSTATFPIVNSTVSTAIPDAAGGWYIGGVFTSVGGVTRNRIAHILSNGTVDTNFDANANSTVSTLTLSTSTNTLYMGGSFTTIGGVIQNFIAAVNATTGGLLSTFNQSADAVINTITLSLDRSKLYVGGNFTLVGPQTPNGVTVSATTGSTTATFLKPNGQVAAVVQDGLGGWYIGGSFTAVGTTTRSGVAHIHSDGSFDQNFDANIGASVNALALSTSTNILYIGGGFTTVGGVTRNRIAAVNATNGSLINGFDPNANNTIRSIAVSADGSKVYIGGSFSTIGGVNRNLIAMLNTSDGSLVTNFNQHANSSVLGLSLSPDGSKLYLGGSFTTISLVIGSGAPLSTSTGAAAFAVPKVSASVSTVVADATGGWYIGGAFTAVGTTTRNRVAHLLSDGSLDQNFNPNANNTVTTATLSADGSILYIGGNFTTIGGVTRNRVAAVNTSDGSLVGSFDPNVNSTVSTFALSTSTNILYLGGTFTSVGGTSRNNIAAVNTTDGSLVSAFDPNANTTVTTIALSASTSILYMGGDFTTVGGLTRNRIAAYDITNATTTSFNPNADNSVTAVALSPDGSRLYLGGAFLNISGTGRSRLAAVNTSDGSLISTAVFNQSTNGVVSSFAFSPDTTVIYIGGNFGTVTGGNRANMIAALTSNGNLVTAFNPNPDSTVNAITFSSNGVLYAGGGFGAIGGIIRNHIAAINTTDGSLITTFNPDVAGNVNGIALSSDGNTLYFGGTFTIVNGVTTRNRIAAANTSDGSIVTGFNPNASSDVNAVTLSPDGSKLYLGGVFTTVGGVARNRIAAANTSDGSLVTSFNPDANNTVNAIAVSADGNIVYLGGLFTQLAPISRARMAAFNTSDGSLVTGFNPNPNSSPSALVVSADGNTLYLGGGFGTVGGITRNNIAAVNTSDGSVVTAFNPTGNGTVSSLALSTSSSILYMGGSFTTIGGTTRNRIAAVNTSDGSLVTSFNPNSNNAVNAITLSSNGNILYIGGTFTSVVSTTKNRIAAVNTSDGSLVVGFNPTSDNTVNTLALSSDENTLYVGGTFILFNGTERNNLAHILSDGIVDQNFNPNAGSQVTSMALSASTSILYIGGTFSTVGGVTRNRIAAVSATSGALVTGFDPNVPSNQVDALVLSTSTNILYVGGGFTTISATTRNRIAAVNTSDGSLVTAFDPNTNGPIAYLLLSTSTNILYLGGSFTTVGGVSRAGIAAVNVSDGSLVTSFNANTSAINSIVPSTDGSILYIGGGFLTVGGVTRNRVAAVSATDGSLITAFNPNVNGTVTKMTLSTSTNTLYFGGVSFNLVGGVTRTRLAAVSATDGSVLSFNPNVGNTVSTLAQSLDGNALYIGGTFTAIGTLDRFGFASFPIASGHGRRSANSEEEVSLAVGGDTGGGESTTTATTTIREVNTTTVTTTVTTGTSTPVYQFTFARVLKLGSIGEEVRQLQIFLNTHGFVLAQIGNGSVGKETTYFGQRTKTALIKFQEAYAKDILVPQNLTRGTGMFVVYSKKVMNALLLKQ